MVHSGKVYVVSLAPALRSVLPRFSQNLNKIKLGILQFARAHHDSKKKKKKKRKEKKIKTK